ILGFNIPKDSPAAGLKLQELRTTGQVDSFLVLDITRGDGIIIPKGSDIIEPGSTIHILCPADTAPLLPPMIHAKPQIVDTVIIGGATRIGVQLAEAIQGKIDKVVLVEPNQTMAEEAAAHLDKTLVLNGDPSDLDVLEEASLDDCDLFCALSGDDQQNIMSSLLAKKRTSTIAAVLVQKPEYVPVLNSLGIEMVINPRQVTVGEILMHVRKGQVQSVTRMSQGRAEILEMEVPTASPAVRAPLKALNFPKNSLLGAVIHDGRMCIPNGDTRMEPGDNVVVFALPDAIPKIEKLFTRRKWF
ncbi:MAG: TrkA C-terminal domain-containing protein, partial [Polyangia bacterium]|nr:TrkA C-terminal domain-containing protein [Polyangia bacterium]